MVMNKLSDILEMLKNFFFQHWLVILLSLFIICLIIILVSSARKKEISKKRDSDDVLICPIRGILKRRKYAANGNYSEEYQTIRLVKWFLKKGYKKEQIIFEHVIRLGRDGHNSLRVDLVIMKNSEFIAVVEVKNNSREVESAIKHQLLPAMGTLNAKYGIYFDGTKNSRIYTRNNDGTRTWKSFP